MSLSNYAEAKILDVLFNNTPFGAVATTYVKLHIGDPGENCTSNPAAHTTRIAASWAAASGGTITTDAAVVYTGLAANETISHISVWDASSGGNPLAYGPLTSPIGVTIGGALQFPAGDIDVTLD